MSAPGTLGVEVATGVEVAARAIERVAAAAAVEVAGVARLEPTLLGLAAGLGRAALDSVLGRDAEDGTGVEVGLSDGAVRVRVCLSVSGRAATEVCVDVSRAVRRALRESLGVVAAQVRTVVVDVAALPPAPAPAREPTADGTGA